MEKENLDNPTPSENLDVSILKKERELRPLRWRMEELQIQFINECTDFAAKWFEETAKEYVTKYSEITFSLSKEKLAFMKAKVNNLAKNSNRIVKAALLSPEVWWHQEPQMHDDFSEYEQLGNDQVGNRFPEKIDKPVRRALGELGRVLEEFGYRVTTQIIKKDSFPEFWFSPLEGTEKDAKPYYPHMLVWSKEMQYTLQQYNTQFKKAIVLFNEIQKLKEEQKQHEASKLWEST